MYFIPVMAQSFYLLFLAMSKTVVPFNHKHAFHIFFMMMNRKFKRTVFLWNRNVL